MSRSGYGDDEGTAFEFGRWRGAVQRSIKGKRGQLFLQELVNALESMQDKQLYPDSFAAPEGKYCALGIVGKRRGIRMDDLIDADGYCDLDDVAQRFGISIAMASEIMYLNDEAFAARIGHGQPRERWRLMREWAEQQLHKTVAEIEND